MYWYTGHVGNLSFGLVTLSLNLSLPLLSIATSTQILYMYTSAISVSYTAVLSQLVFGRKELRRAQSEPYLW